MPGCSLHLVAVLNEGNWKRSVRWAGADPKGVQRILGHASAAMAMDLCGHLIDRNLWEAAARVGVASRRSLRIAPQPPDQGC